MRVWLVTVGEPLPTDEGVSRLLRAGILANLLAAGGHEVVWWTSTFDHSRKQQRFSADTTLRLESGVLLKLMHGCHYSRNVSLRRLVDHAILSRKFSRLSRHMPRPDVILCSLPPLELPVAVTRYGKANGVPVILDVRDLWPDLFVELVPRWARPVFNLALAPMWRQARTACRDAFAITGNAPKFVEWGLALASRTGTRLDRAFPHGYDARTPAAARVDDARTYWQSHGIQSDDGGFVACFFGAIGPQSELDTVIDAARLLEQRGRKFKFVLCGKGDHLESLREKSAGVPSVLFPGWIGAAEIWALMRMSTVGLAVYRSNVGYVTNLPNKPIEYLSAGLPIVSSLKGYLERFLEDHGCGLTYPNGDAEALAQALIALDDDRTRLAAMSGNARQVFMEKFDADKVYGGMISYLEEVVDAYAAQSREMALKS